MADGRREASVDLFTLMRKDGVYSDFTVRIGKWKYRLHKAVLRRCSGFFESFFRLAPNRSEEVFRGDHLLFQNRKFWEKLLDMWYGEDGVQIVYPLHDRQKILERCEAVCQYLSCRMPKNIVFEKKKPLFPSNVSIDWPLGGKKLVLTVGRESTTFSIPDRTEGGPWSPVPEEEIEQLRLRLNEIVEKGSGGGIVDLFRTLEIGRHQGRIDPSLRIQINGQDSVRYWNDGSESIEAGPYEGIGCLCLTKDFEYCWKSLMTT